MIKFLLANNADPVHIKGCGQTDLFQEDGLEEVFESYDKLYMRGEVMARLIARLSQHQLP